MSHRHCPYCNSTAVVGLGAAFMHDAALAVVEMRCRQCGELFISDDRRNMVKDDFLNAE